MCRHNGDPMPRLTGNKISAGSKKRLYWGGIATIFAWCGTFTAECGRRPQISGTPMLMLWNNHLSIGEISTGMAKAGGRVALLSHLGSANTLNLHKLRIYFSRDCLDCYCFLLVLMQIHKNWFIALNRNLVDASKAVCDGGINFST